MNIIAVTGFALLSCAAAVLIKNLNNGLSGLVPALLSVALIAYAVTAFEPVRSFLEKLGGNDRFSGYYTVMLKGTGTAILGQSAVEICRDCGENAIANGAEICTKAAILLISLPLITELMELAGEMLSS